MAKLLCCCAVLLVVSVAAHLKVGNATPPKTNGTTNSTIAIRNGTSHAETTTTTTTTRSRSNATNKNSTSTHRGIGNATSSRINSTKNSTSTPRNTGNATAPKANLTKKNSTTAITNTTSNAGTDTTTTTTTIPKRIVTSSTTAIGQTCIDTRASGSGPYGSDTRGHYTNGVSSQCVYYKNKGECNLWGSPGCEKTCDMCVNVSQATTSAITMTNTANTTVTTSTALFVVPSSQLPRTWKADEMPMVIDVPVIPAAFISGVHVVSDWWMKRPKDIEIKLLGSASGSSSPPILASVSTVYPASLTMCGPHGDLPCNYPVTPTSTHKVSINSSDLVSTVRVSLLSPLNAAGTPNDDVIIQEVVVVMPAQTSPAPPTGNVLLDMFAGGVNCGHVPALNGLTKVQSVQLVDINIPLSNNYNPKLFGWQTGNNWVARFTATLLVSASGFYTFSVSLGSADTAELWVNGQRIIQSGCNWGHGATGGLQLTSGPHSILLWYADDGWKDRVVLSYQGSDTGGSSIVVPSSRFVLTTTTTTHTTTTSTITITAITTNTTVSTTTNTTSTTSRTTTATATTNTIATTRTDTTASTTTANKSTTRTFAVTTTSTTSRNTSTIATTNTTTTTTTNATTATTANTTTTTATNTTTATTTNTSTTIASTITTTTIATSTMAITKVSRTTTTTVTTTNTVAATTTSTTASTTTANKSTTRTFAVTTTSTTSRITSATATTDTTTTIAANTTTTTSTNTSTAITTNTVAITTASKTDSATTATGVLSVFGGFAVTTTSATSTNTSTTAITVITTETTTNTTTTTTTQPTATIRAEIIVVDPTAFNLSAYAAAMAETAPAAASVATTVVEGFRVATTYIFTETITASTAQAAIAVANNVATNQVQVTVTFVAGIGLLRRLQGQPNYTVKANITVPEASKAKAVQTTAASPTALSSALQQVGVIHSTAPVVAAAPVATVNVKTVLPAAQSNAVMASPTALQNAAAQANGLGITVVQYVAPPTTTTTPTGITTTAMSSFLGKAAIGANSTTQSGSTAKYAPMDRANNRAPTSRPLLQLLAVWAVGAQLF